MIVANTTPRPAAPPDPDDLRDGYELVDGKQRRLPMGALASWIGGRVGHRLEDYCLAARSGVVFPADTGYQCFPGKPLQVRKPDVSVIPGDPTTYVPPASHLEIVPVLVVEVVSPRERAHELADKVNDFRSAGTPLIWVIDPHLRQATVYRADGTVSLLTDPAELSGEGILPGFVLPLATVLPPVTAS